MADLAIPANDGRPDDHHAVLQHRAFADGNLLADVGRALAAIAQVRADARRQVGRDFGQRLPGVFAAVKNRGVLRLFQIKQFIGLKHAPEK